MENSENTENWEGASSSRLFIIAAIVAFTVMILFGKPIDIRSFDFAANVVKIYLGSFAILFHFLKREQDFNFADNLFTFAILGHLAIYLAH